MASFQFPVPFTQYLSPGGAKDGLTLADCEILGLTDLLEERLALCDSEELGERLALTDLLGLMLALGLMDGLIEGDTLADTELDGLILAETLALIEELGEILGLTE